jgi:glycosyltransferase involved in cell wall biosynthesis
MQVAPLLPASLCAGRDPVAHGLLDGTGYGRGSRMRYLHVLESFARGGVETTFLHMLRVFRGVPPPEAGADVHDVVAFAAGPLHRDFANAANRVIVSNLPIDHAALLANDYDVVHVLVERCAHRLAPMVFAGSDAAFVYGKNYDTPTMLRMQGLFDATADESILSAADAVMFTTLDLAAGYRLPPGRTTILRKAAAIEPALAVPVLTPDLPLRALAIASLHPRKRLADLIPIMQMVRGRVPQAELRIVGAGSPAQVSELRDRIEDAGLSGAITLLGQLNDVEQELAHCRVFVLPSVAEGVPTVLLEAMAAARPIVSARVGHIGHILTDGCEGFLTTPGDLGGFATRVATLLEHHDLAARMGAAGRARAATHDVRAVATDLLRVLRRAAAARRRTA